RRDGAGVVGTGRASGIGVGASMVRMMHGMCSVVAGAAEIAAAGRSPRPNPEGGSVTIPQRALVPSAVFMQLVTGECVAHCISAAAHLGLADRMVNGPQPSDELAHACGPP